MEATSHLEQVQAHLQGRAYLSGDELEALADLLLADTLCNRGRTKSRREEYPILSARQWERRLRHEIPFTALSRGARLSLGLNVGEEEAN